MNDETTDADIKEFLRELVDGARTNLIPQMKSSAFCMTLLSDAPDIKLMLEVGAALLLDKPLIILAVGGLWIPPRLRSIADVVVEGASFDDDFKQRLQSAVRKFVVERGLVQ